MKISLIVPCYNEQEALPIFYRETKKVMESMDCDYEMIFVNDGSKDGTLELLKEFAKEDTHVTYIGFSRNFGKESAIFAGLANAEGDCCAVMDCDLQHPPEKIVEMYRLWQEGYEVVEGIKSSRGKESPVHTFAASCFY